VGTARQCCANQLGVVPSLQRDARSGRRASEDNDNLLPLYFFLPCSVKFLELFLRHDDDELKTGVLILMFNRLMSSMTI